MATASGEGVLRAVTPRAAALVLGVLLLQLLFIASYVGALHHPSPSRVPFGVVAPEPVAGELVSALAALPGEPLDPRAIADEDEARRRILDRGVDGALIVDPSGSRDTLLVASGGGTVLADALTRIVSAVEESRGRTVATVDVAPAAADRDFDGLSSFYVVVGWCVGGYLCAAILAISAGAAPLTPRRAVLRTAALAVYAIAGGAGGAAIVGSAGLDALPGGFWPLAGLGALVVFAVGVFTAAMEALFGVVGIGLAILVVVIAGNPSAGGAFPPPMLPDFFRAIGPVLPPGAGTWTARSIAYFDGNAVAVPLTVLAAWAAAGTVMTIAAAAWRTRRIGARDTDAGAGAAQA